MDKRLIDRIIGKLKGEKFKGYSNFKYWAELDLEEAVKEFEYDERRKDCEYDAQQFLERANKLILLNRGILIEKLEEGYDEEDELDMLKILFTATEDYECLVDEYGGFDRKHYYEEAELIEDEYFWDDLSITNENEYKYKIMSKYNNFYVELEHDENGEDIIIKNVKVYE